MPYNVLVPGGVPDEVNDNTRCALIEANLIDEHQAMTQYHELKNYLSDSDKKIIDEIISDELNHAELLKQMVYRISRIKPAIT